MLRPTLSTRSGDKGDTSLLGGKRVSKASVRLHAYGTVDELNACVGLVLSEHDLSEEIRNHLLEVQRMLFVIGADLASPIEKETHRISLENIEVLEKWGISLEQALPTLQNFILPSGSRTAALLHQARTVCRRGERWAVDLSQQEEVNPHALVYLNRLSDYLFLAARSANKRVGRQEEEWSV